MSDPTQPTEVENGYDDDYALDRGLVSEVLLALTTQNFDRLSELFEPLHPADIADLLEQVGDADRRELILFAGNLIDGEVLSEIDESIREEVIEVLPDAQLVEAVRELESDDVVDILEDLDEPQQETILDALDTGDRIAVEQALSYPEFSAGRLMQREVVSAPEHWNVGAAIDHLRSKSDLPEQFYHIILVDPRHRPVAYVTLGRLMSSDRSVPLADITEDSFRTFRVDEDEGDIAYAFNQYHLISAPVVDADGRLAGVITIDDAMVVLDEEHEEDVFRLAGVGDESLATSTLADRAAPLPLAGREPCNLDRRLNGDCRIRGRPLGGGRLGCSDAHRRLNGGKCRNPIHDGGSTRIGHPRPDQFERP